MRYAIISDIHANSTALRAVLADAADAHVEKIICLGDVLGYGPDAVETLELVYRRVHVCLAGNHDDAIAGRFPVDDFSDFAADAVRRQHGELSAEAINWLAQLPYTCEFPLTPDLSGPCFACAHGDFSCPEAFNYILEAEDAVPSWEASPHPLLFVGHTHKPAICVLGESGLPHLLEPANFALEPGKRYIVNVGSVGYPRAGACRSFYCIYDDQSQDVFFRSIPFDLDTYNEKMNGRGLDEAPWLRAQTQARQGIDVRTGANFARASGKKKVFLTPKPAAEPQPEAPHVRVTPHPPTVRMAAPRSTVGESGTAARAARAASTSSTPLRPPARKTGPNLVPLFVIGGLLLVFALAFAVVKARNSSSAVQSAPLPPALPLEAPDEAVTAPPTFGTGAAKKRIELPNGTRRVSFSVQLRGTPCWVRLHFEDPSGLVLSTPHWYPNVKKSRRSPKAGVAVPATAKFAVLTVIRMQGNDPCVVSEIELSPGAAKE